MKQILLTTSMLIAGVGCAMAWNVSTEQTMQTSLIEEFTGIHCPNCPDGHRIATELMNLHPGDVYSIAVHAGSYATPSYGEPNYITDLSQAIHDHFEVTGYPTGTVSRHSFDGRFILDRGSWGSASRTIINTPSPVNLWSETIYDESTRKLTVNIEGYFTEDMTDPRLNVFLLQSEILGPQSGGQKGEEYSHRHMLRGRLTDADFGDPIATKTKGEYFSRTITYTLPEAIDEVPVDVRNIELLTFVTDGEDNVRKVSASHPDISGMEPIFKVDTSAPYIAIGKNWAFDYVEILINNHGTVEITEADFDITINGELTPVKWTGSVPGRTNKLVRVPLNGLWDNTLDSESNKYVIRMMKANGQEVETSSLRGTFYEIANYPNVLTFKIKTDLDAADNTYRILDRQGNVVKEFGPYESGKEEEYTESVELNDGEVYCFEVGDCWGDGIRHPLGNVKIYDKNDKLVVQYREIDGYGMRQFFRTDSTLGIEDAMATEPVKVEYTDLSGRTVAEPAAGVYIVRSTMADGTVVTEKRIIR